MNQEKCSKCNFPNDNGMQFCTNCGNPLFSMKKSELPTVGNIKNEIPTVVTNLPTQANSSSSKLKIVGLLGCLGLGFIGVCIVGLGLIYNFSQTETAKSNSVSVNSNKKNEPEKEGDDTILAGIFQDKKEVGKFKQLSVNSVKKEEFFTYSTAAKQANYHDGSKYVSVAIGKFKNFDDAKRNFDEQFANVKKKGGKTQILETSVDGTINGVYQVKDVFSAEYCTKSVFCYRLVSKDARALKYFIEHFLTL